MIPQADIIAWRRVAPWGDDGMVEQDLVLSRALVGIFSDAAIAHGLALRVRTFHLDELLGTKLRALYQRRRGRDLFDLWDASRRGDVNPVRAIEAFQGYLKTEDLQVSHGRSSSVIWRRRFATGSSSRK